MLEAHLPFKCCVITTALLCNFSTLAQTAKDIEVISVTSRYWQESLLVTPQSVSTYLQNERYGDLRQLDIQTSNVRIEQSSVQSRIAMRGSSGYDTSLQQPVGIYVNDVALPLGGYQLPALFNMQRVEVIKGPAGDLYGRHSAAGLVKFVNQSPSNEFIASMKLSSGVTDGADGNQPSSVFIGKISGPVISDDSASAIAIRLERNNGPQLNLLNDSNNGGELTSRAIALGIDTQITDDTSLAWRSNLNRKESGKANMRYSTGSFSTPRFTTNYNTHTFEDTDSDIHSLRIDRQFADIRFSAITGITNYSNRFNADLDLTPAPIPASIMAMDDDMISQEFRWQTTESNAVRWLAGLYWYNEDTDIDFALGGSAMLPRAQRVTTIEQSGVAAFGQLDVTLNSLWQVTMGLRAERIKKVATQHFNGVISRDYSADLSHTVWLPKVSLSYALSEHDNLYFSYAKGYLPAGYNYASAQNVASFTYRDETTNNAEFGYKASLLDERLTIASSLFYIQTKDKQINDLTPGFVQIISNAAQASSRGVELDIKYHFTSQLSGFVNIGTMEAKADEYRVNTFNGTGFVMRNLKGNDLPMAPQFTYAAGLNYSSDSGWFANLAVSGSDDYYFDANNLLQQPSHTVVDLGLGYQFDQVSVALVADNVFDEEIHSRSVQTNAGIVVEDTRVRYIGLNVNVQW